MDAATTSSRNHGRRVTSTAQIKSLPKKPKCSCSRRHCEQNIIPGNNCWPDHCYRFWAPTVACNNCHGTLLPARYPLQWRRPLPFASSALPMQRSAAASTAEPCTLLILFSAPMLPREYTMEESLCGNLEETAPVLGGTLASILLDHTRGSRPCVATANGCREPLLLLEVAAVKASGRRP
jgi:hypothetical protein